MEALTPVSALMDLCMLHLSGQPLDLEFRTTPVLKKRPQFFLNFTD